MVEDLRLHLLEHVPHADEVRFTLVTFFIKPPAVSYPITDMPCLPDTIWATDLLSVARFGFAPLLSPFLSFRQAHGLSVSSHLGPDDAEQNFHRLRKTVDCLQRRYHTQASGAQSLLPPCLPPLLYATCAVLHPSPLQGEPDLPADLVFAISLSSGVVPGIPLSKVLKWRTTQLRQTQTGRGA